MQDPKEAEAEVAMKAAVEITWKAAWKLVKIFCNVYGPISWICLGEIGDDKLQSYVGIFMTPLEGSHFLDYAPFFGYLKQI